VFTATAISTLALGIGGTTAIFTLIHAVMLRSLPVGDPSRLYRVGDGDACCVQGGPQDRWGLYSFPLFERCTNEIGIRIALGADRSKVVAMVLNGAFRRVAVGLALGLPLAVGAGRLLSAQLYGVKFWDPPALVVAAASLAACAFVAALVPAARAASISPTNALRAE
jgi:hypothetical protein